MNNNKEKRATMGAPTNKTKTTTKNPAPEPVLTETSAEFEPTPPWTADGYNEEE